MSCLIILPQFVEKSAWVSSPLQDTQSTISSAESEDNIKLDEYIKIEERNFDTEKTTEGSYMVSIRLMMSV
jgi:hypothetical protein